MDGRWLRRFASPAGPGANLCAVATWEWDRSPEWSHVYFRATGTSLAPARAGFEVDAGLALSGVWIRWLPGLAPQGVRLCVQRSPGGAFEPVGSDHRPEGTFTQVVLPDARLFGVSLELVPAGGPVAQPHLLAFAALSIVPRDLGGLSLQVESADATAETPMLSFPGQPPLGCVLDLHRARALHIESEHPRAGGVVTLRLARLGPIGRPDHLRGLVSALRAAVNGPDGALEWVAVEVSLDDSAMGQHAGEVQLHVRLGTRPPVRTLRLEFPVRPPQLALLGATWAADAGAPSVEASVAMGDSGAPSVEGSVAGAADDPRERVNSVSEVTPPWVSSTLASARQYLHAPLFSASVGIPGTDERLGIGPDGTLWIRPRGLTGHASSQSAALHVSFAPRPAAGYAPDRLRTGQALLLRFDDCLTAEVEVLEPAGAQCASGGCVQRSSDESHRTTHARAAQVTVRTETARRLTLAFTLRDGLVPLPLRLALRPEGTLHCLVTGRVVARFPPEWIVGDAAGALAHGEASGAGETRIVLEVPAGPEGLRFELVLAEGPPVSTDASDRHVDVGMARPAGPFGPDLDFRLPDPVWEAKVRALLDQAALFFLAGDRVPYGLYPSVYDGDVFGLEEDWLFFGLALWGQGDAARRAFRRTYLNDAHLAKTHPLHDLRNGLTPWQALRLSRLAGDTRTNAPAFLSSTDLDRLRALGEWTLARRAETPPDALPGLLPPYRYGGDLDFPTQSLSAAAVNVAGLHALTELLPDGEAAFGAHARDFRGAWQAGLDAVRTLDAAGRSFIPMHTGGGDPGQYHALMVAGIVEPLGLLPPGDPRLAALHAQMEASGTLRLGLPRFDGWGTGGRANGVDAHYAIGYLLDKLHGGENGVFWQGLCALLGSAMDPAVSTFREVSELLGPGEAPRFDEPLPGRLLGQSEPCVGGIGVALQLIRHTLLAEVPDGWGLPSRRVRILPAPLPGWWTGGDFHLVSAPTAGGPVTLRVENRLVSHGEIHVRIEGREVEAFLLHAPMPPGWRPVEGTVPCRSLPPGAHAHLFRYVPAAAAQAGDESRAGDAPTHPPPRVRAALIPAAGLGTRLLPATLATPKELLPLGRCPAIAATLLEAVAAGLSDLVLIVSPAKDALRRVLDPSTWPAASAEHPQTVAWRALLDRVRLQFVSQDEPRGALDAIARGRALLGDEPYLVVYPDYVHLPDQRGVSAVLTAYAECQHPVFAVYLAGQAVDGRHGASVVATLAPGERLEVGRATRFSGVSAPGHPTRPPAPGEVRTAFAVVQDARYDALLERIARRGATYDDTALTGVLDTLAREGQLSGTLLPGELLDLGVAPGYLDAARRFATGEARLRDLP